MTPFARKVYKIVSKIPVGETRSYQWVARKAGSPRAYRAVGQILKHNPWPVIIPCHRVVAGDKTPGGYAFGVRKKKLLLEQERIIKQCLSTRK
ncbi:MAG: MGMT family protein [Candidatus Omnitrophota bacterium]